MILCNNGITVFMCAKGQTITEEPTVEAAIVACDSNSDVIIDIPLLLFPILGGVKKLPSSFSCVLSKMYFSIAWEALERSCLTHLRISASAFPFLHLKPSACTMF
ncbi:uncharacterized protein J3R85_017152 [Psidium guajava]|nr:uncharacterized protein J3R85_017152 [Psidium guajava]